jgi:hypothetical protein
MGAEFVIEKSAFLGAESPKKHFDVGSADGAERKWLGSWYDCFGDCGEASWLACCATCFCPCLASGGVHVRVAPSWHAWVRSRAARRDNPLPRSLL